MTICPPYVYMYGALFPYKVIKTILLAHTLHSPRGNLVAFRAAFCIMRCGLLTSGWWSLSEGATTTS